MGLDNVNNTSDANKEVSTLTQAALNLKANISGGTFTGPVIFNNFAPTTFNSTATFNSTSYMNDVSANTITTTTNNFGFIGTTLRRWGDGYINNLYSYIIRPTDYFLSSIGTGGALWPLVYIKDIFATNLTISGSFIPFILTGQEGGSLGLVDKRWKDGYINSVITYYVTPGDGTSSIGSTEKLWPNLFIRNIYATSMSVSGNLEPLNPTTGKLGSTTNYWSNAYITNISASNISITGGSIDNVSSTQLSHLEGASSNIQTQINTVIGRITTLEDRIGWTGRIIFTDEGANYSWPTPYASIIILKGDGNVASSTFEASGNFPSTNTFTISTQGATTNIPIWISVKTEVSYLSIGGTYTFDFGPSFIVSENRNSRTYRKYKIPFNAGQLVAGVLTLGFRFTVFDNR